MEPSKQVKAGIGMRKNLRMFHAVLLCALLLILCFACTAAVAETVNGLTIEDKNGVSTVTAFDGSVTEVVVPEGVEAIYNSVFQNKTAITSVSLPSTLKTIGADAFYGCTLLRTVNLPESLTSIGNYAFYNCTNLT